MKKAMSLNSKGGKVGKEPEKIYRDAFKESLKDATGADRFLDSLALKLRGRVSEGEMQEMIDRAKGQFQELHMAFGVEGEIGDE